MQNKTYDFTGTRCLIDYDGTIANSLGWYNEALDELYMDKVTDEHYIDHYHDFGDAYNLIPGCPWKTILADLCEFLSVPHVVSYLDESDDDGQIRWLPQGRAYDIGKYDCLMKVTYDADFVTMLDEIPAVLYKATNPAFDNFGHRYVIVIADCLTKELSEKLRDTIREHVNDDDAPLTIFCDRYMSEAHPERYAIVYNTSTIFDNLHSRFEEAAVRALKSKNYEQLALEPIITFLKTYRDAGGSILIHSGSNRIFIDTINEKLGIADLFDDILCSDMLSEADKASRANEWCGYKMVLFEKLMERNGTGEHDFVVGDTKGDGFAAYESNFPFFLVWRGYPKNPQVLRRGDDCITPNDWMDGQQERIDDAFANDNMDMFADDIANMLSFAEKIKAGGIPAMTLFREPR